MRFCQAVPLRLATGRHQAEAMPILSAPLRPMMAETFTSNARQMSVMPSPAVGPSGPR